jgi:hypothetical protein
MPRHKIWVLLHKLWAMYNWMQNLCLGSTKDVCGSSPDTSWSGNWAVMEKKDADLLSERRTHGQFNIFPPAPPLPAPS